MSEIKLKPLPCPLCSAKMKRIKNGYEHPSSQCVLSGFVITDVEVKKWNTRKPMERIVERLEERRDTIYPWDEFETKNHLRLQNEELDIHINIVKEEGGLNDSTGNERATIA